MFPLANVVSLATLAVQEASFGLGSGVTNLRKATCCIHIKLHKCHFLLLAFTFKRTRLLEEKAGTVWLAASST